METNFSVFFKKNIPCPVYAYITKESGNEACWTEGNLTDIETIRHAQKMCRLTYENFYIRRVPKCTEMGSDMFNEPEQRNK